MINTIKIQSHAEHAAAIEKLSVWMSRDETIARPEDEEMVKLAKVIEQYEAIHFPIAKPYSNSTADTPRNSHLDALADKVNAAGLDSANYTG
ncbi:MAG TPA: hypothetical protein DEA90_16105 [Opitutae bacterium]|nr:hypothetical protein [Puniceicoccaceae bacterium]HBR95680.1 hypothetical protein [Opitutae bacterium]|tara:strand:- start:74 stop:349 length:276 start_codon:yes stop_codon:yes gene_type:complete